jgi:rubrerythrin
LKPIPKDCVECGHLISSTAKECPSCSSKCPHGHECRICKKVDSESALERDSHLWVHSACFSNDRDEKDREFERLRDKYTKSLVHSCPVCGTTRHPLFQPRNQSAKPKAYFEACPGCGHETEVVWCFKCFEEILLDRAETVHDGGPCEENPSRRSNTRYYHESCSQSTRPDFSVRTPTKQSSRQSKPYPKDIVAWCVVVAIVIVLFLFAAISAYSG